MPKYRLVASASRIPAPGGKLIDELFGRINTGDDKFSLAHMVAPPGWTEPAQTPEFGELTIVTRGSMTIEVDGETVIVGPGQAFWVEAGVRVRYSNPGTEDNEYYAVCMPAFSIDKAHRDA
ncbi:MAG: cupin domain-containing protein [Myxococcota bacterium]